MLKITGNLAERITPQLAHALIAGSALEEICGENEMGSTYGSWTPTEKTTPWDMAEKEKLKRAEELREHAKACREGTITKKKILLLLEKDYKMQRKVSNTPCKAKERWEEMLEETAVFFEGMAEKLCKRDETFIIHWNGGIVELIAGEKTQNQEEEEIPYNSHEFLALLSFSRRKEEIVVEIGEPEGLGKKPGVITIGENSETGRWMENWENLRSLYENGTQTTPEIRRLFVRNALEVARFLRRDPIWRYEGPAIDKAEAELSETASMLETAILEGPKNGKSEGATLSECVGKLLRLNESLTEKRGYPPLTKEMAAHQEVNRLRNGQPCHRILAPKHTGLANQFVQEMLTNSCLCRIACGHYGDGKSRLLETIKTECRKNGIPVCLHRLGVEERSWRLEIMLSNLIAGIEFGKKGLLSLVLTAGGRSEPTDQNWKAVLNAARTMDEESWTYAMMRWLSGAVRNARGTNDFPQETRPAGAWGRDEAETLWQAFHTWMGEAGLRPAYLIDEGESAAHNRNPRYKEAAADVLRQIIDSAHGKCANYSLIVAVTPEELTTTLAHYPALKGRILVPEDEGSRTNSIWYLGPDEEALKNAKLAVCDIYKTAYPEKAEIWEELKSTPFPLLKELGKSWRAHLKGLTIRLDRVLEGHHYEDLEVDVPETDPTTDMELEDPEQNENEDQNRPKGIAGTRPTYRRWIPKDAKTVGEKEPFHTTAEKTHKRMEEIVWIQNLPNEPEGYFSNQKIPFTRKEGQILLERGNWKEGSAGIETLAKVKLEIDGAENYGDLRSLVWWAAGTLRSALTSRHAEEIALEIAKSYGFMIVEKRRGIPALVSGWTKISNRLPQGTSQEVELKEKTKSKLTSMLFQND